MHQGESPAARSARGSALPWILIAATALVLGMLGAHALEASTPVSAPVLVRSSAVDPIDGSDADEVAAHAEHPIHTGESLSETGHLDLAAICMLALLFTVAALVRALPVRSLRVSERIPLVLRPAAGGLADPPRPSLLRLGICRT